MKKRHQYFIFLIIILLFSINIYEIYSKVKFQHENQIENIGNTLAERLLNTQNLKSSGSGLYKEQEKYVFKGNPNNYITFNNELWRIVSLEKDGTIKILKNTTIEIEKNYNEILEYLNTDYYNSVENKKQIKKSNFNVASADISKLTTIEDLNNLTNITNKQYYIGLLDVKEVASAASTIYFDAYLNTYFWVNRNYNYLYLPLSWLTLTPSIDGYICVNSDFFKINKTNHNIRPALYLKETLYLDSGKGTKSNPYILKE